MRMGLLLTAAMGAAATVALVAQAPSPVPRTANGRPDFEGTWYFGTATPLERPVDLAAKSHFSSQAEAAEFERQTAARIKSGLVVHPPDWLDYGTNVVPDLRTSLIVDPPDGRVPPLTASGHSNRLRLIASDSLRRWRFGGPPSAGDTTGEQGADEFESQRRSWEISAAVISIGRRRSNRGNIA